MTQLSQKRSKTLIFAVAGTAVLALSACTTTGNMERNAAGGAAIGALAGAVIGNNTGSGDAGDGAVIGAALGGAAGAYKGYRDDQDIENRRTYETGGVQDSYGQQPAYGPELDRGTRYFDTETERYYFYEKGTSRTFYENGDPRS